MALQFFDGFDDYGVGNAQAFVSKWSTNDGGGLSSQIPGLFGGFAISLDNSPVIALTPLANPVSEAIVGGRFLRAGATTALFPELILTNSVTDASGTPTLRLTLAGAFPSPTLQIINSAGTVLAASSPLTVNFGEWYELELQALINTSTGSATARLNGTTILSVTGVNTQGSSASNIIGAAGFLGNNNIWTTYWDDFYICDTTGSAPYNTFLSTVAGPMGPRVYTVFPNSDSSVTWTPLSGSSNYAMVDEQSFDADTSYVSSNTAGQQDLYGIPALSGITNVLCVKTSYVARMDDSGFKSVSGSLHSGSTTYQGTTETLTGNYQKFDDYYLNDPDTSAAWNVAKLVTPGDLLIGVKCVA